jgi:hypothetical protein
LSGNVGDGVGVFSLFGPGDSFGTLPVPVVGDGVLYQTQTRLGKLNTSHYVMYIFVPDAMLE